MAEQTVSIVAILKDQLSGPLRGISRQLGQVAADAQRVGSAIGPLASKIGVALAGLAGLGGASAAIAAAEEATQAERGLLAALGDRVLALERIKAVSSEIAKTSTFDDDAIVAAAAHLARMGTSAEKLPGAMQAAADVAAALQIPLEAATTAIGQIGANFLPRELSRAVPVLRELEQQGRLAADGVAAVAAAFPGAAQALAETPFGRAAQDMNELGNQSEKLGDVLIRLKVAALDALLPVATKLADIMASPGSRVIVDALIAMTPVVVGIGVALAGITAAFAVFATVTWLTPVLTAFGAFLVSASSVLFPVLALAGGIAAVGVAAVLVARKIPAISTSLDGVTKTARTARDNLGLWVSQLEDRTLRLSDLFGAVALAGDKAIGFLQRQWEDFVLGMTFWFTGTASFAQQEVEASAQSIAQFLAQRRTENLVAVERDARKQIGIEQETHRKKLDELRAFWAEQAAGSRQATDEQLALRKLELDEERRLGGISLREYFDLTNALATQALAQQLEAVNRRIAAERLVLGPLGEQATAAQAVLTQVLEINKAEAYTANAEQRAELAKSELAAQRAISEVGAQQVDAARRLGALLEERRGITDQIALSDRQAGLERLKLADDAAKSADAVGKAYQSATAQALELFSRGAIGIGETAARIDRSSTDLSASLAVIRADLVALFAGARDRGAEQDLARLLTGLEQIEEQLRGATTTKLLAETVDQGNKIFADAKDALSIYQESVQTTTALAEQGILGQADAQDKTRASAAALQVALDRAQGRILALAAEAQGAAPELADLARQVQELQDEAFGPAVTGTFLSGFTAGIRGVAQQYESMRQVGLEVGQTLAHGVAQLGADLVGAFTSGEKQLKQFFARFLSSIAQAITQALILRAIMGFFGGAAGAATPAQASAAGIPGVYRHSGGLIRRFAPGGHVGGPNVNRDIVPAWLTPGEYVQPREVVRTYGVQAMEMLRRRLIPPGALRALMPGGMLPITIPPAGRFATGGMATASAGGSSGGAPTAAFLVADEQAMDRLVAGGRAALLRFMERESGSISAILGRGGNRR